MIFYISFETVGKKALRFKNALKMYRYGLLNPPNVQPHFSSEWEDFLHTFIPLSLSLLLSYLTYTHAHTLFFDAHSSTFIPSLTHTNTHSHTHTHIHISFLFLCSVRIGAKRSGENESCHFFGQPERHANLERQNSRPDIFIYLTFAPHLYTY